MIPGNSAMIMAVIKPDKDDDQKIEEKEEEEFSPHFQ